MSALLEMGPSMAPLTSASVPGRHLGFPPCSFQNLGEEQSQCGMTADAASPLDARVGIQPRGLPLKHPGVSYLNSLPPVTHPENGIMRIHSFPGLHEGKRGRPLLPPTGSRRGAGGQLPSACVGVRGSLPPRTRALTGLLPLLSPSQPACRHLRPDRGQVELSPGAPFVCMR